MVRLMGCCSIVLMFSSLAFAQQQSFLKARVISEGYLNNRQSFNSFKCKFIYSTGIASNYEKAIRGDFEKGSGVSFTCTWIVKGDLEKYELLQDPKSNQVKGAESVDNTTIALKNGGINLVYAPPIKAANIRSPESVSRGNDATPFNMVIMGPNEILSPYSCVQKALAGEYEIKDIKEKAGENSRCYMLSVLGSKGKDRNLFDILIDPAMGYLPVEYKIHDSRGQKKAECKLIESKKMANGSWFPFSSRTLVYMKPDDLKSKIYVYDIKVTELEAVLEPKLEEFYIDLPKGTEISNPSNMTGSFGIKENRRIGVSELDAILRETVRIMRARKGRATSMKQSDFNMQADMENSGYFPMLPSLLVVLVFVLGLITWRVVAIFKV